MLSGSSKAPYYKRLLFQNLAKNLHVLSWLAFLVGLVWFLMWPQLSKNTYFSENALGVGQQHNKFTRDDLQWAEKQTNKLNLKMEQSETLSRLAHSLHAIGLETRIHNYQVNRMYFNQTVTVTGTNLYATLRAPKGSGKESIVLRLPFTQNQHERTIDNIQMGLALMRCFSRQKWLHHDLIFVVTDQTDKQWAGDEAFITSQEIPTGKMREAIVLDFDTFNFRSIGILTEGFNGELPNLDLVNTVIRLAQYQGIDAVSLFKYDHNCDDPAHRLPYPVYLYYSSLKFVREYIAKTFKIPKHDIIGDEVFDKSVTVMHHVYNQLIGLGTGGHSWYRKHSTHALTMTNSNGKSTSSRGRMFNMVSVGRIVEGTVRSMNNLIEELHQSFFLYFMDSINTYYGFEHYMPNLLTLVAPIILQFVGNHYLSEQNQLVHSLSYFVVTAVSGGIIYILPFTLQRLVPLVFGTAGLSAYIFFGIWLACIVAIIVILFTVVYPVVDRVYLLVFRNNKLSEAHHSTQQKQFTVEWRTVKSFTMSYCCIILGVLLVLESAFCIITSIYLFILSAIMTKVQNYGISKYLQLIALLIISPFTIVGTLFAGYFYNLYGFKLNYWINAFDYILSQQFMNMNSNIVFVSMCTVFIPVWLMFFKLTLVAIQNRIMEQSASSKQKMD